MIFFFIIQTYLINIVLILKGEILSWSLMGVKGLKNLVQEALSCKIFKDNKLHLPYGLMKLCCLWKFYLCLLTSNCTQKYFVLAWFHSSFLIMCILPFRCRILGFNSLDGLVNLTMERWLHELFACSCNCLNM